MFLGAAPWLVDRVEALGYPLPTTIQINSFEAVNALLSTVDQISLIRSNADDTLEDRLESGPPQNFGVVISGSTGVSKYIDRLELKGPWLAARVLYFNGLLSSSTAIIGAKSGGSNALTCWRGLSRIFLCRRAFFCTADSS